MQDNDRRQAQAGRTPTQSRVHRGDPGLAMPILQLQREAGNAAVSSLLSHHPPRVAPRAGAWLTGQIPREALAESLVPVSRAPAPAPSPPTTTQTPSSRKSLPIPLPPTAWIDSLPPHSQGQIDWGGAGLVGEHHPGSLSGNPADGQRSWQPTVGPRINTRTVAPGSARSPDEEHTDASNGRCSRVA